MKPDTYPADAPPQFRPVQVRRAADDIARQIREEIDGGRLKPGSKLPAERLLAAELGVSRNTLREAVRSLEQAGLVQLKKGARGGIFISEDNRTSIVAGLTDLYRLGGVTPAQLIQAFAWMTPLVVREAHARATEADFAALHRNIEAATAAMASGDFAMRFSLNHEFHRMLARLTGNPIMIVMINGLTEILVEYILRIGDQDTAWLLPARRRFLTHFERGDIEAASAEMVASLQTFLNSYFPKEA
ncbi:FadR/GntR family transcriptional regulator [Cupriavidus sp. TKC]|uniref:FadR/GntR family transcriptional regulator n=1 Tax=Cupriavidus sp. TKC TaxID=2880159 RepID=UPI00295F4265|nr:GntR family transcriptional regulator [Cupriavidus sp. TKC]